MNDDAELLRRYAEQNSEAAFTELVHRHLDLVYGSALRRTSGDSHTARELSAKTRSGREARRQAAPTSRARRSETGRRAAALRDEGRPARSAVYPANGRMLLNRLAEERTR